MELSRRTQTGIPDLFLHDLCDWESHFPSIPDVPSCRAGEKKEYPPLNILCFLLPEEKHIIPCMCVCLFFCFALSATKFTRKQNT